MLESFLSMSPAAIVTASVLLPVFATAPLVIGILSHTIPSSADDATVLSPTISFVGTSFSLLLAFVTVTVWSDQTERQKILFAEMTAIEDILVESKMLAPGAAPHLKTSALKYLDVMRANEINDQAPSGGDPATERAFEETLLLLQEMSRAIGADPARQAQAQGFFDETREWIRAREERVNTPAAALDGPITGVLLALALLTVVLVALLPATSTAWAKWVQSLGVAVAVGLTLSLVFYLSSDSFTRDGVDQQITRVQQALAAAVTPSQASSPWPPSPAAPR